MRSRLTSLAAGAALVGVLSLPTNVTSATPPTARPAAPQARQQVAELQQAALPATDPGSFPQESVRHATAAFLHAWHTEDWKTVDYWTSPASGDDDRSSQEMLARRFGSLELSGFKVTEAIFAPGAAVVIAQAWSRRTATSQDVPNQLRLHLARETPDGERTGDDSGRWVVVWVEPIDASEEQLNPQPEPASADTDPASGEPAVSEPVTPDTSPAVTDPSSAPAAPTTPEAPAGPAS